MRSACLAVALLLSASAGAAGAQTAAAGHVGVNASVEGVCRLGPPSRPSVNLGEMAARSGMRVGRLATLLEVTENSSCRDLGDTRVAIRAEALVQPDSSTPPADFARAVNCSSMVATRAETPPPIVTDTGQEK